MHRQPQTQEIGRQDFAAAAAADPEVQAEFLEQKRREAFRRQCWVKDRSRNLTSDGETYIAATEEGMMAGAVATVQRKRAYRASDEGQYLAFLAEAEGVIADIQIVMQAARSAAARSFTGEATHCRAKAHALQMLAAKIETLALDAYLAADRAADAAETH